MRMIHSREKLQQITPDKLKRHWKWMRYSTNVQQGMICELCEQTVPEKVRGRFKCVRCKARYCSKEHQKAAAKFHHRYCITTAETTTQSSLPSPLATVLTNDQIQDVVWNYPTNLHQNLNIAKYVVDSLTKYGHCVLDHFHGEHISRAILNEVTALHAKGSFKDGQLQSTTGHGTSNSKVREDEIVWMNGNESDCNGISQHMTVTDTLLQLCNFFIKNNDIEHRSPAMVACYPGKGTGYKRHIDNPNKDGRLITTIYYLNQGWKGEVDGGVLKLFPEQACFPESNKPEVNIEPVYDRLLLFWSDKRNPHEVCPAYRRRYAITLWYFDSAERKMFFEQLKQKQMNKAQQSDLKDHSSSKETPKNTAKNDRE